MEKWVAFCLGLRLALEALRFVSEDLAPNGDALRKCILSGPYKPTTVLVQAVAATDDSSAIPEHTTEFSKFTSHDGETMESYYTRFYKLMNEMIRNNLTVATMQVNVQFLQQLQPEWSRNQKTVNVAEARENVGSPVVQQSGIQCFNCKEFGHFSKECRKPKRVKDFVYHKEKMLLCKQAEQGVPLQAEQYDWLADTNEEIDEQELEAHYSYMAKIQENDQNDVESDDERVALANLIANLKLNVDENKNIQKQLKKANTTLAQELKECKTILAETNQFRASTAQDMEILIHTYLMPLAIKTQNDSFLFVHELKQEMHADLKYVESIEKEIDELEYDKVEFSNMYDMILQECVSKDVMSSYLLSLSDLDALTELQCLYLHKVKECDCLTQKLSNQTEPVNKKVQNELLQRFAKVEKHSISLEIALQKYLKAQLQDKNIAISELKKLIEKGKGKSVDTKFGKPSVVRQPNAQRILKPSVLGRPAPFSNSLERIYFSKAKSIPKTNVSEGLSKSVTAQTLPQTARHVVSNTNMLKPERYQIDNRSTQTRAPQSPQTVRNTNPRVSTSTALPTQAWLWHQRLSCLNFDYISLLSKKDVMIGLPKLKYVRDQLCSSFELGKAKRSSFKSKAIPSSKGRLNLLHMDLCGLIRVASINGKKYILKKELSIKLLLLEHLNRMALSKDETVLWLRLLERCSQLQNFLLFFWAEAIATACYTQNRSIIILTHDKTPYHIINDKKPSLKHLYTFCCICYITRDGENLDKMKEKGDLCIRVGYTTQLKGYHVYNKRTRMIVESIHIRFDEIKEVSETSVANDTSGLVPQRQKASDYDNSNPGPQLQNVSSSADAHIPSQQQLDLLFGPLYNKFFNAGSNPQDKQPSTNIQPTSASSTLTYIHAEENNNDQGKEDHLPDDEFTNPFCTLV
nr:hypothetical protein [Tanacetum cinerariifolium]